MKLRPVSFRHSPRLAAAVNCISRRSDNMANRADYTTERRTVGPVMLISGRTLRFVRRAGRDLGEMRTPVRRSDT